MWTRIHAKLYESDRIRNSDMYVHKSFNYVGTGTVKNILLFMLFVITNRKKIYPINIDYTVFLKHFLDVDKLFEYF